MWDLRRLSAKAIATHLRVALHMLSLAVLMDRYAHFIPTMQDAAARLLDEITADSKAYAQK